MAYENILTETRDRVAIITLNRPQRLNALSDALADELGQALEGYDADPGISVIVITGSAKALAGYALGGGCELAMACDFIVAADSAKFGQPEITIGTMPGFGGTQRLPRAVGKAKAMDWCLTGRMIDAAEAERAGLVSRVVPADRLLDEALAIAAQIAGYSLPVVMKVKEAVNRAFESSLAEGLLFERREFHATFALDDQKEGMRAFVEKRKPAFRHR
jgi:enoyl-CoA hydratase